jgi:DNA-binding transcriptional ArsR family regulator
MRTPLHPASAELSLPTILYALGDPLRLKVVGQLATLDDAISCGDIQVVKEVPKSTGSHLFKVLREAGLIRMTPQGRRVLVALRREDLERRFPGLLDTILETYQHGDEGRRTEDE